MKPWAELTWEPGAFFIVKGQWDEKGEPVTQENLMVDGVTRGPFGIFQEEVAEGKPELFSLTHAPTGFRVIALHSYSDAVRLADGIVRRTGTEPWEVTEFRAVRTNGQLRVHVIAAVQELFPDWTPQDANRGWGRR